MSLIIRIAILVLSGWCWQYLGSGVAFVLVFVGTVLACFWIQFHFERN